MKAIVKSNLNLRTGAPEIVPDNNPGYYKPGDIIEIKEKVFGVEYKGNNVWYKLENGGYVWSGGIDTNSVDNGIKTANAASFLNYNSLIPGIPDTFRNTKGKGTTIAILDSGCATNFPDLQNRIIVRHDAIGNTTEADDTATDRHGTFIAGLLCGNGKIGGIVPEAELIIVKVLQSKEVDSKPVKDGLSWLLKNHRENVDVISMSFDFDPTGYDKEFDELFKGFKSETIMVAASGDNAKLYRPSILFPASHDLCYGVGALASETLASMGMPNINGKSKTLFSGFDYTSYFLDNSTRKGKGSSYATGICSGLMAMIIAYNKENKIPYDRGTLAQSLSAFSDKLNSVYFSNELLKPYIK